MCLSTSLPAYLGKGTGQQTLDFDRDSLTKIKKAIKAIHNSGNCHYRTPRTVSYRVVYFDACATIMLLFLAYSVSFIMHLTVRRYNLPFVDFRGLLEDDRYEVGTTRGPLQTSSFKLQTSSDPVLNTVYGKYIYPARKDAPRTALEVLTEICTRKRYTFFTSVSIYHIIRRKLPCVVIEVPQAYYSKAVSLVMRKGSPFKRLFIHKDLEEHYQAEFEKVL